MTRKRLLGLIVALGALLLIVVFAVRATAGLRAAAPLPRAKATATATVVPAQLAAKNRQIHALQTQVAVVSQELHSLQTEVADAATEAAIPTPTETSVPMPTAGAELVDGGVQVCTAGDFDSVQQQCLRDDTNLSAADSPDTVQVVWPAPVASICISQATGAGTSAPSCIAASNVTNLQSTVDGSMVYASLSDVFTGTGISPACNSTFQIVAQDATGQDLSAITVAWSCS